MNIFKGVDKINIIFLYMIAITILLTSCKPSIPSEYIQPKEMENILYDYHIANSIAISQGYSDIKKEALILSVYKKHNITKKEFDNSLKYYTRHTSKLKKIYENLSDKLTAEAKQEGTSINDLNQYGNIQAKGDTINIWHKAKTIVFSPFSPENYKDFELKPDTSYHKGDQFTLEFDSQFIIQDDSRNGVAVISVTYSNDSIATETLNITSDTHNTLFIQNPNTLGIKRIRGFFMMLMPQIQSTTFRTLILTNIKLIKMHQRKDNSGSENNDSTNQTTEQPINAIEGDALMKKHN